MESYDEGTTYGFFLNCVLNSRVDLGVDTEDGEDNFLNAYLAGVLASRVNSEASPIRFHEIFQIVKSDMGDRERILRLQREGDKGLVFHGLFSEEPERVDYVNVGTAYNSAASICDKIEEPIGEIFSYLDQNLELCIDLFQHVGAVYISKRGLTETEVYRMTLAQNPEDALDSFLDYYKMFNEETDSEKKEKISFHLQEARKVAQKLNPHIVFPEIG